MGLSGDDYTGLLALAGGVVLLAVGAVRLWRSRRREDRLARRYGRRLLLTFAAALVVAFILFPLSLSYGLTHVARTPTESGNLGAPYRDVHMRASKVPEVVTSAALTAGVTIFANQPPPPSLVDLVPKIAPTATFFIHATNAAGGEDNNPDYSAAAGSPKQIWKIETSHTHGLTDHPQEYEQRVVGFFDRNLRGR